MTDYWNQKPDLTRLPAHLKGSLNKPIPLRDLETRARVIIFPFIKETGLNNPNGRVQVTPFKPKSDDEKYTEGLQIEQLDFTGQRPLVTTIVKITDVPTVFEGAFRAFKYCGGDLGALKAIIEEIEKT